MKSRQLPVRIGLYLRSGPANGGVFQYGAEVLRGLKELSPAEFELVVVTSGDDALRQAQMLGVNHRVAPRSVTAENFIGLATSLLIATGVPIRLVQHIGGRVDPFAKLLQSLSCDVWFFPTGDPIVYRARVNSAVSIHDLMHIYEPRFPEVGRWSIRVRRELHYRALCAAADAVLVDSELGATHVHDSYRVSTSRIHVLPYCAPEYVEPGVATSGDLPPLPEAFFYYPARFWPHKNHLNLARAVRICRDAGVEVNVVLAGGGPRTYPEFSNLIETLGVKHSFTDLGYVPDRLVRSIYERSVGLIYPTFFGPTNIPPLEALVCGAPMALSNNYAMREQAGDAALYFDPADPAAIAEAMIQIATDAGVRKRLTDSAREMASSAYSAPFRARFRRIVDKLVLCDRFADPAENAMTPSPGTALRRIPQ